MVTTPPKRGVPLPQKSAAPPLVVSKPSWITADLMTHKASTLATSGLEILLSSSADANSVKRRSNTATEVDAKQVCHLPCRLGHTNATKNFEAICRSLLKRFDDVGHADQTLRLYLSRIDLSGSQAAEYMPTLGLAPPDLAKEAYNYLSANATKMAAIDGNVMKALACLGVAFFGLRKMELCRFCPRWAFPGTGICPAHSQARSVPGSPSEKAARYRFARDVGKHYNYYQPETPVFATISNEQGLRSYVSRLLWSTVLPDEERTAKAVKEQIRRNVLIQNWVGHDFNELKSHNLYIRLRETIDPFECRPRAWRWKLQRLRLWLTYADMAASQPRKRSRRTRWRLYDAQEYEALGWSKTKIAEALGISPATISQWLKRSGASSIEEAYLRWSDSQMTYTQLSVREFEEKLAAGYRPSFPI